MIGECFTSSLHVCTGEKKNQPNQIILTLDLTRDVLLLANCIQLICYTAHETDLDVSLSMGVVLANCIQLICYTAHETDLEVNLSMEVGLMERSPRGKWDPKNSLTIVF